MSSDKLVKAIAEEISAEFSGGRQEVKETEEAPKPKKVVKPKPSPQPVQRKEPCDCWDTISRIVDSFCSICENPNMVRRLSNKTFDRLVNYQMSIMDRLLDEHGGE